jgi:hypothetical protein
MELMKFKFLRVLSIGIEALMTWSFNRPLTGGRVYQKLGKVWAKVLEYIEKNRCNIQGHVMKPDGNDKVCYWCCSVEKTNLEI